MAFAKFSVVKEAAFFEISGKGGKPCEVYQNF